jgi:hypothetical protein
MVHARGAFSVLALNWGATEGDLVRVMAGDGSVPRPNYQSTMALEIDAGPEHIWPWLVQMGCGRGGLYSYDWLDRLFGYLDAPSARAILPEFQGLRVGDVIPIGRGGGFPVLLMDPLRALVLGGAAGSDVQWVWEFGLYPIAPGRTRLVSRSRAHLPHGWRWRAFKAVLAPAAFLMARRMLLGLRERAERLARERA